MAAIGFIGIPIAGFGQVYTNAFTGTGACPTQGNTPTTVANATGTPLSRNTVTCNVTNNVFNSTTLNNTASVNSSSYVEFSVSANPNAQLNVTSLSFFRQGSATAPNQLEVRYSTDGFATSTTWAAPNTPTTGTVATWDFADFSVPPGTTLTFRFYPYGTQRADLGTGAASASGTFRLDDVTVNGTAPLPVGFVSFTGKSSNNTVVLNWVTAWEEKNQGFDIQRSTNAQSFEGIGFVAGNSTTTAQSVYEFTDTNVMPQTVYYYRLKQKDTGTGFDFSKIIAVRAIAGELVSEAAIFPNPNKGSFRLAVPDAASVNARLYTASGTEVPIHLTPTENPLNLDISAKNNLAPGLYFLKLSGMDGAKINSLKVLVSE
jgi:hypothetical protein